MKARKKGLPIGCVLIVFSFTLIFSSMGFCAEDVQQSNNGSKTLKIGCVAGMSGFSAGPERTIEQGSRLAQDWINKNGGITIKGRKYLIELVTEDHKSSLEGAAAAATKLVYDHQVKFIAGGVMPFTNIAIHSVTEPAKVLHATIYNCAVRDEYGPRTPYTFVTMNGSIEGIDSMLRYISEAHPEIKTIAATLTDDSIRGLQPRLDKIAESLDIKVLGDIIGYAPDTIDYTPVVKKLIARKPDAICLVNGWPAMTGAILKVARQCGYTKRIFMTNYQPPQDMVNVSGKEASNGFLQHGILPDDPHNQPVVREVYDMLQSKYGHTNLYYTCLGFDNLWMLVQAIEAAQSLDATVVRDTWEKMDSMKSVWGKAVLGGLETYGINHTMTHPIPVLELTDGNAVTRKWMEVTAP